MKINGTTFPNFNKGYVTEIRFPFEKSRLGNNTINQWDAGNFYDQYKCSGRLVLDAAEKDTLYNIYNNLNRGESVTLTDCVSTGFFPFSPAVAETSFTVYIDNIKDRGMSDDVGKLFMVDLDFLWEFPNAGGASTITWNNPLSYCKEGSFNFLCYEDVRFPSNGFKIKKGHGVVNQNTRGPQFYGVNFPTENNEWNQSTFILNLRTNIASNMIYNLMNVYRNFTIFIEGKDNYYIFGKDQGDNTQYSVKLNDDMIKIKHIEHENFEIEFDVVKV